MGAAGECRNPRPGSKTIAGPDLWYFSLLELPPSQLDFLRRLGQYIDIYIFHFNPSQEYWADSVDPDWKARFDLQREERFIQRFEKTRQRKPNDAEIKRLQDQAAEL